MRKCVFIPWQIFIHQQIYFNVMRIILVFFCHIYATMISMTIVIIAVITVIIMSIKVNIVVKIIVVIIAIYSILAGSTSIMTMITTS